MVTLTCFACGVGSVLIGIAAFGEFLGFTRAHLLMKQLSNSSHNPEAAVVNMFGDKPVQMHQVEPLIQTNLNTQENSHSNTNKFLDESLGQETTYFYDVYQLKSQYKPPSYVGVSNNAMVATPVGGGVNSHYKYHFGNCSSHNKVHALKTKDSSMAWTTFCNNDSGYCKTYYITTRDEFLNFCSDINEDYKQVEFTNIWKAKIYPLYANNNQTNCIHYIDNVISNKRYIGVHFGKNQTRKFVHAYVRQLQSTFHIDCGLYGLMVFGLVVFGNGVIYFADQDISS